jgi:hypothetical protein
MYFEFRENYKDSHLLFHHRPQPLLFQLLDFPLKEHLLQPEIEPIQFMDKGTFVPNVH